MQLIKVHSSLTSLQGDLPKHILPAEYGGDSETMEEISERLVKQLETYRDYFKEEANYGFDEKLAKQLKKK